MERGLHWIRLRMGLHRSCVFHVFASFAHTGLSFGCVCWLRSFVYLLRHHVHLHVARVYVTCRILTTSFTFCLYYGTHTLRTFTFTVLAAQHAHHHGLSPFSFASFTSSVVAWLFLAHLFAHIFARLDRAYRIFCYAAPFRLVAFGLVAFAFCTFAASSAARTFVCADHRFLCALAFVAGCVLRSMVTRCGSGLHGLSVSTVCVTPHFTAFTAVLDVYHATWIGDTRIFILPALRPLLPTHFRVYTLPTLRQFA